MHGLLPSVCRQFRSHAPRPMAAPRRSGAVCERACPAKGAFGMRHCHGFAVALPQRALVLHAAVPVCKVPLGLLFLGGPAEKTQMCTQPTVVYITHGTA